MYESVEPQSSCSFPVYPNLTSTCPILSTLNPCLRQPVCTDEPASNDFHPRVIFVYLYLPSANKLYSELAGYLKDKKLTSFPTFIPMHTSLNKVLQNVGSLVSSKSNPVCPASMLKLPLFFHNIELYPNVLSKIL